MGYAEDYVQKHAEHFHENSEFDVTEFEVGGVGENGVETEHDDDHHKEDNPAHFNVEHELQQQEQVHAYEGDYDKRHKSHEQVFLCFCEFDEEQAGNRDNSDECAADEQQPRKRPSLRHEADHEINKHERKNRRDYARTDKQPFALCVVDFVFLFFECNERRAEIAEFVNAHIVDEVFVVDAFDAELLCSVHQLF